MALVVRGNLLSSMTSNLIGELHQED